MQIATWSNLALQMQDEGALPPWLGPAIRGLIMRRFKNQVCRQPEEERPIRWRYCDKCPHLDVCDYGVMFEPRDGSRLMVASPAFPVPETAFPGLRIPLHFTAIGRIAAKRLPEMIEILDEAGQNSGLEFSRVRFAVEGSASLPMVEELRPDDLPPAIDRVPGMLPRVGVGLIAPLGLRTRKGAQRGKRVPNTQPTFGDFFRSAASVLENTFKAQGEFLAANVEELQVHANTVPTLDDCYEPFSQKRYSGRQGEQWDFEGVIGGAVFGPVPFALLPWIYWGGQLHAGNHRSSGAGGWRIVLD